MTPIFVDRPREFDVSVRDFTERARASGWPFWRGVLVGFAASFPLAYMMMMGENLFGP